MEGGVAAVQQALRIRNSKKPENNHVLQTWIVQSGLIHREVIQEQLLRDSGKKKKKKKKKQVKSGSVYVSL